MTSDLDQFDFSSYRGFNGQLVRWRYETLRQFFSGSDCLELGSSDGQGTAYLLRAFPRVVAVDGSTSATAQLRARYPDPSLQVITAMFETLDLSRTFHTVVLAHVLEHVEDPLEVLAIAKRHLHPEGVLLVDVPNALSLHRQLGVAMGLLGEVTDLNDADRSIGHRRVYSPDTLADDVRRAGFRIDHSGGVFLKVLSNAQTETAFDDAQLDGFRILGEKLPDLASEIYIVARHG